MVKIISDLLYFFKRRFFVISWILITTYLFCSTFLYYKDAKKFHYLRQVLGVTLCVSRGTASVLNMCCALILLPMCKKLNQLLYRPLAKVCPAFFFFILERTKSFHMTIGVTMLLFAVIHSISHMFNLWNFTREYKEEFKEINFAHYKNENPLALLMSLTGLSGLLMLLFLLSMGVTSMRTIRRKNYNAFWYTHQLYLVFLVLLMLHPLSGVLKEEVLTESYLNSSPNDINNNFTISSSGPKFIPIKSMTWIWMVVPLTCFSVDLLWRICSRNLAKVNVLQVTHMPGRTICLKLSCPYDMFVCKNGQYVLLQCLDLSLIEWHPFTVVQVPTTSQREFMVWIRVKGDWTESLENIFLEKGFSKMSMFVDGPFSSPMEGVGRSDIAICVAAGVGITPFVSVLTYMLRYPKNSRPNRIHLLWIVKREHELKWLADIANKTLVELREANRIDRLHLEFYVTSDPETRNKSDKPVDIVIVNENGKINNVIFSKKNTDENVALLRPFNKDKVDINIKSTNVDNNTEDSYDITKQYPILGCRVKRGRPHWNRMFGYWVHLYPGEYLDVYCCGPKNLVNEIRKKCKLITRTTKTQLNFVHEGFS